MKSAATRNTVFGPYSIRNLRPKSAKQADNGYTATLLCNGEAVAAINCGTAPGDDDLEVEFKNTAQMQIFQRAASAWSGADGLAELREEMPADEMFLRALVEHTYHMGRLDFLAKTSTLFRLSEDPPGFWRQVRAPFRRALAAAIQRRYAKAGVEFAPAHQHQGLAATTCVQQAL